MAGIPEDLMLDGELTEDQVRQMDPSERSQGVAAMEIEGERAFYAVCRHCVWGFSVRVTKEDMPPRYKDMRDSCLLGVSAPSLIEEVQECSGLVPRSLSPLVHLAAWRHRRTVRLKGLSENRDAVQAAFEGKAPWGRGGGGEGIKAALRKLLD